MSEYKVLALDTETTGISNHPKLGYPQIVELAYIELSDIFKYIPQISIEEFLNALLHEDNKDWFVQRYKPSMAIHPEATKIHGIKFTDVLKCSKSESIELPKETKYVIGHNIQFDYRCLGKPEGVNLICSLKLIRAYCKFKGIEPPSKKLDPIIEHFFPEHKDKLSPKLHNAKLDVIKVILLLILILKEFPKINNFDTLYEFQRGI